MSEQPSMDWKPRHVTVTGDGLTTRVLLDGADISRHVQGLNIEHRAGQVPVVVLYAHPNAGATFDGIARIAVADQTDPADPGETVAAFLENIDPDALERAALDRDDLESGKRAVTAAILRQLADWAQGRS